MAASNVCVYDNADDESDYSFEYVTDSEYEEESEEDGVQEVVVEQTIKIPVQQEEILVEEEKDESPTNTLSKEQIEAMKPKLPHYVTDPEPCAFSDDPAQWIAWMESQVNKERERRMKQLMESNSFEATEVNHSHDDSKILEDEPIQVDCNDNVSEDKNETTVDFTDTAKTIQDRVENVENVAESEMPEAEMSQHTSVAVEDHKQDEEVITDNDNESEWEYEDEGDEIDKADEVQNILEDEIQITDDRTNVDDNMETNTENDADEQTLTDCTQETDEVEQLMDHMETSTENVADEQNLTDCTQETDEVEQLIEKMETNPVINITEPLNDTCTKELDTTELKTAEIDISSTKNSYKKQISCPAIPDPSVLPDDMQRKIDFIRKRKAMLGQTAGESQATQAKSALNDLLDEETQKKIAFVRQKKIEASQQSGKEGSQDNLAVNTLLRQMSTPEKPNRPQSFASDAGLDDMLTRIKALRNERKQILQDMSAIKSAFNEKGHGVNAEPGVNDDGIGSGNNTPSSDMVSSFTMDTDENSSESPTILAATLSKQRRSIDSGWFFNLFLKLCKLNKILLFDYFFLQTKFLNVY